MSENITIQEVADGVTRLAAAVAIDVKNLKDNKADKTQLGLNACLGVNMLSDYLKEFTDTPTWFQSDVTVSLSTTDALKHIRGTVLSLESASAPNSAAVLFLADTDTDYLNVELEPEQAYVFSFYAKSSVGGKQLKAVVKTADGVEHTTAADTLISGVFERYSLTFVNPTGYTGAAIAFYPNLDAELGNVFQIQGLMLERVVSPNEGEYAPSDYAK